MEFIRNLAILLLVVFGLRLIFRELVPWLLRRAMRKAQERLMDQMGGAAGPEPDPLRPEPPGPKGRRPTIDKSSAEDVDFEEIDK